MPSADRPRSDLASAGRIRCAIIVTAILGSVLVGRLIELQVITGPSLASMAESERRTTRAIPATRGSITDVTGDALAMSVKAVDVVADQTLVVDPARTAAVLAPLLNAEPAAVQAKLTGKKRFVYVQRVVSANTWQRILAAELPGIFANKATQRVYPGGTSAGNILGFMGLDGHGLAGIERVMDTVLAGRDGVARYERDPAGRPIPDTMARTEQPVRGSDVRLTLDRDIQWSAESELAAAVKVTRADYGTVVVMDPRTGDILAQATVPSVDPASPAKFPAEMRGNRAVSDIYEPGSTSKMMTMAAVLDSGKADPLSKFKVPYSMRFGSRTLHDHDPHGLERLTLNGILAYSSNIGTYLAAKMIGEQALYDTLKKFGIAEHTGINLPGESRGLLPHPSRWSVTSFPTIAYGQGLSLNAIQAASAYAAIANDGVRVTPRIVAGTVSPDGKFTASPAPAKVRVVSSRTSSQLRSMLETVVQEGTGAKAAVTGYRVAGKTGTASRFDPKVGGYNGYVASFIGMLPAEAPRLVIAVSIHNPHGAHYGGVVAAPVFSKVATFAVQHLRIPPSSKSAPQIPLHW